MVCQEKRKRKDYGYYILKFNKTGLTKEVFHHIKKLRSADCHI